LQLKVTRAKLEQLTQSLVQRCRAPFEAALSDASSRRAIWTKWCSWVAPRAMPMIQQLVRELAGGKEPNKSVNPDEVVAVGAAIQAGVLAAKSRTCCCST